MPPSSPRILGGETDESTDHEEVGHNTQSRRSFVSKKEQLYRPDAHISEANRARAAVVNKVMFIGQVNIREDGLS